MLLNDIWRFIVKVKALNLTMVILRLEIKLNVKIVKREEKMTKETLFNKLRDKGIFWSYSKDISYQEAGDKLFLEYLLKYGDFDDLVLAFRLYPKEFIKSIWENNGGRPQIRNKT